MFSILMTKIQGNNIYQGFDASAYELDTQGWGSTDPVFSHVIKHLDPKLIVEVGTWKGASAIHMAELAPQIPIICIDTWLGSVEHYTNGEHSSEDMLFRKNGFPNLYHVFLSNVVKCKKENQIIPLVNTSQNGAKILEKLNIKADLIYIDASHEYVDVYLDLCGYYPLLKEGGVIIGDDFYKHGVQEALGQFMKQTNVSAFAHENKYVITACNDCVPPSFVKVLVKTP